MSFETGIDLTFMARLMIRVGQRQELSMQTFNVQGMTCAHCERAVTNAIQSLDAQARVRVDRQSGVVEVEGDLGEAAIRKAIEQEGYQVG